MPPELGRVLIIAGSDSGGGAGIQGDIKTVSALGGYAATAITALTAQNTQGVFGVHDVPEDFIRQQIKLVLGDIGADAIKTGMLHKASVIEVVAETLTDYPGIPLIVDPVMVAKGGTPLLQTQAIEILVKQLFPRASLITPNVPEAELLCGQTITTVADMKAAGQALIALGARAILIKGGHLKGDVVTDILMAKDMYLELRSERIDTRHTHGTGCALASAVATGIAQKMPLADAVTRAHTYVQEAIRTAPGLGKGHGPLNHRTLIH